MSQNDDMLPNCVQHAKAMKEVEEKLRKEMRLINVIQAIDNLDAKIEDDDTSERAMGILEAINELGRMNCEEAVEAEPVKHGRWIKNEDKSGWHCSCCGKDDLYAYPYTKNNERELQDFYCPNCGAKMERE